jgi:hypothetical protein
MVVGRKYGTASSVETVVGETPQRFELLQNYPNPFNPTTAISFQLSEVSFVTLKVFDVLGREITTLVNEMRKPGLHTVQWDASSAPSGVYLYRLRSGEISNGTGRSFMETKRMTLLR